MSDAHEPRAPRAVTLSDRPDLRRQFEEALASRRPDYQGYYLSVIAALARFDAAIQDATPQEVAESLSPKYRQDALAWGRGLPHYIRLLQDLVRAIETQRPSLKVVRDE
jgi:hypothetical protein